MALGDSYASVQQLRTWPTVDKSTTDDDLQLGLALEAATQLIDNEAGWTFNVADDPVARTYQASAAAAYLRVDNIASTTGLEIKVDEDQDGDFTDETAWAATDYQLRRNGLLDPDLWPSPRPWNEIWVPSWSSKNPWNEAFQVQVTAVYGWPGGVPAGIVVGTIELAALILIMTARATNSINEMQQVVGMSRQGRDIIHRILAPYGPGLVIA